MDQTIYVSGKEIDLKLHPGQVIHANKYAEASGGAFNLPVTSTLNTDVVVRMSSNNEDLRIYIRDLDLPVYNGQEVSLLAANGSVVALIDLKTRKYYYTTTNFQKKMGLGIPFYWVWAIGIVCAVLTYLINPNGSIWLFVPFLVWIPVLVMRWQFNSRLKQKINEFLAN